MKYTPAHEAVALILHDWYSGYTFDKCPNGPECGLMKSCRSIADKVVNTVKKHIHE